MKAWRSERGAALVEAAVTIPLLLLVAVGIFEFGRAYQTWQVLTNASREGARMAAMPGTSNADVTERVRAYMASGALTKARDKTVIVGVIRNETMTINGVNHSASHVSIAYPYSFMVLAPVVKLVKASGPNPGAPITMQAASVMRNEAP